MNTRVYKALRKEIIELNYLQIKNFTKKNLKIRKAIFQYLLQILLQKSSIHFKMFLPAEKP